MKTRAFWARQRARQNKRVIVPQRAVRKFLARDRRDYNRYRTKSLQWLERRIMRLPVRPPIWKALRKEQRVGLVAGVETQKFCYWYDMGMGKTMLAIALTRYFERVGIVKRVLVLIPNKVNKNEWAVQIKKHSPKSTYTILRGSSLQKWEQLESAQTTFILETYGGLVRMLSKMVTNKKNKNKLKPHLTFVKRLLRQIQGIVMDESIMITRKDRHGSIMHRLCRKISKTVDVAFALNGTPFGRDPTDMWGQFHVIDEGETLGETLGLFRATFFKATANYWGGFDYRFDKKHEKLLHEIIGNRSIRYEADESTLPKVVPIVKPVSMPNGADEFYEKAKEAVIASRGNYEEMQNAFLRMRQISSGFIGYDDDELGTRAQFEFTPNPKKELLLSDLQSITPTNKAVVFHEFTFSGDMIERMLKQAKIPYARLYGKTKDPDKAISKFHDDPKCRVFVLQNSMAIGLDRLKVAKYGLYFESPGKTYMRVQSLRRIRRQGSEHDHVFIIDYVVNGTVDQDILDAHEQGIDLFEAIVEGKRRLR